MDLNDCSAVVTGGASGLGGATVRRLAKHGVPTVILDLPGSDGAGFAAELGPDVRFVPADVTDPDGVERAMAAAEELGPLRVLVHCAGLGGTVRVLDRDGRGGSLDAFRRIVEVNLVGTFNVLRLASARMAGNPMVDGERGTVVLTSSVAAWEGQIGQIAYASSKAGIVGMTLVAARDLASSAIRVCTIAPGVFDTPILDRFGDELKQRLASSIPHPRRLGRPEEFADLTMCILANPMLNGETVRLDGALRMTPS